MVDLVGGGCFINGATPSSLGMALFHTSMAFIFTFSRKIVFNLDCTNKEEHPVKILPS